MPFPLAHVPVTCVFCLSFEHATLILTPGNHCSLSLEGPSLIFPRDFPFPTKSQLKYLLLSETFLKEPLPLLSFASHVCPWYFLVCLFVNVFVFCLAFCRV